MIHEVFPVGILACNCSVIGDEQSGEAVVIDPGDDIEQVQQILLQHKLRVKYIIATHAHIDHVGGVERLQGLTGAAVLMHQSDLPLYQNLAVQAEWLGVDSPGVVHNVECLKEGDKLEFGPHQLDVLHTPGHSPGSVCLHLPGPDRRIFSGDTLFQSSIGRTDLWGGSFRQIIQSIREKLFAFPDEVAVFPGHGPETTIGEEREHNPFLNT